MDEANPSETIPSTPSSDSTPVRDLGNLESISSDSILLHLEVDMASIRSHKRYPLPPPLNRLPNQIFGSTLYRHYTQPTSSSTIESTQWNPFLPFHSSSSHSLSCSPLFPPSWRGLNNPFHSSLPLSPSRLMGCGSKFEKVSPRDSLMITHMEKWCPSLDDLDNLDIHSRMTRLNEQW